MVQLGFVWKIHRSLISKSALSRDAINRVSTPLFPLFGRGCASSGLSWQAAPANKNARAGTACVDRVDKVLPCPNSRGGFAAGG
ncbi:MAG: hypothetical protein LBD59_09540 [Prevotellaceae bacterium]|nr:hypothetical protein [Prevotellaceae bacterium]